MEKKYLVFPGHVRSRHDGEEHLITAMRLMELYKVNPEECIVVGDLNEAGRIMEEEPRFKDMIHLAPRWDGDYTLPTK